MNFRRIFPAILLFLLPFAAQGQFFSFGADPSWAKWSSIRSEDFKLIYPRGMDSLARTYLFNLEKYRKVVNESMLIDTKPIPVVLHPYTVMSNGCVSWAPKIVNLITSPDAYDGTPEPWIEQLATHELRHVGQTEQFTKGFFGPGYWVIGEQATGIGVGLCASPKFLEGDAVLAETQFSQAGRGRNARFLMYQRALYLDGVKWGWEKSAFGSYRYKDINPYCLGYTLMSSQQLATGRFNYSGEFFKDKARLYDVTKLLQKKSERKYPSKDSMINLAYDFWGTLWTADAETRGTATASERISRQERLYCEYTDALPLPDGSLLAHKSGLQYAGELVLIGSDGTERIIGAHSQQSSNLSVPVNGRIYWSEASMHDPGSLETFSEIWYKDLNTGRKGALTLGAKYFNPDVSADGNRIAVAEYPVEGGSNLVILSAVDGSVLESYPAPDKGQVLEPCFHDGSIYATSVGTDGIGIYRLTPVGEWEPVVSQQRCEIRHLRSYAGGLCFASDLDGLLNIYAFEPQSGILRKLTNAHYGADYPYYDADAGVLYYSEFDRFGFRLAKTAAADLLWEDADFAEAYLHPVAEMLSASAGITAKASAEGDPSYFDEEKYPSRKYNKFLNSFHIHSWAPVYYNVDRIMNFSMDHYYDLASLGAAAYSQNELGTLVTMLGYSYHGGFHSAHGKITATVADFDVEASLDVNDRKQQIWNPMEKDAYGNKIHTDTYKPCWKGSLMIDYPLNLYGGGWLSMAIPYVTVKGSNDLLRFTQSNDGTECIADDYLSFSIQAGARYYRMRPVAKAALFPRTGFSVTGAFDAPLLDGCHYTSMAMMTGYVYAPGFTRSQGLKLSWGLMHQFGGPEKVLSKGLVSLPRGYSNGYSTVNYAKIGVDYGIPVWLGDVALSKILYLKRLDITPFAEFARDVNYNDAVKNYGSFGTDLMFRFNALRIGFEVNGGLRYAHTIDGHNFFGPLFGMSIK